jgi:hypothetical protein
MNKIAILDNGTAYNLVALHKEPFNQYFEKVIYFPKLVLEDLVDIDILVVTCLSNIELLVKNKAIFEEFLSWGKKLVVMGRNEPYKWLDGIIGEALPFNYWWWLDENENIDFFQETNEHELFSYVDYKDMIWHYHDGYKVPDGAVSLVSHKTKDASIYFEYDSFMGGSLIVTSLDPFFHHGSFFMPNSSVFGEKFLKYLQNTKG